MLTEGILAENVSAAYQTLVSEDNMAQDQWNLLREDSMRKKQNTVMSVVTESTEFMAVRLRPGEDGQAYLAKIEEMMRNLRMASSADQNEALSYAIIMSSCLRGIRLQR